MRDPTLILRFRTLGSSLRHLVKFRVALALCASLVAAAFSHAEIGIGDTREEVLRQLGKPTSIARRGDHEILLYPKGGRVEILAGKVADVKGPLPGAVVSPAQPTVPVQQPAAPSAISDTPLGALQRTIAPAKAESPPQLPQSDGFNPGAMAQELGAQIEKMETGWGAAPPIPANHSPLDSLPLFITGLLIRFTFTVFALKLAFKYWEMDAFWSGVFIISGIDLVLHAILELLGPASGGLTTLVAVENGIAGLVMVLTIHRFCFNKRIQNALFTAMAVKVVVTVFYMFAGIAVLSLLYR
jgi:hypothetical protein